MGEFDLTKATTYREALILINKSIEMQGRDLEGLKNQIAELSDSISAYMPQHANTHVELEKKIAKSEEKLESHAEKLREMRKWNIADTVNLLITAITAAITKYIHP
jgi:methyl-accepting chemotaxis protein